MLKVFTRMAKNSKPELAANSACIAAIPKSPVVKPFRTCTKPNSAVTQITAGQYPHFAVKELIKTPRNINSSEIPTKRVLIKTHFMMLKSDNAPRYMKQTN